MIVLIALLVPVALLLMMFALDILEALLFPPPTPTPDEPEPTPDDEQPMLGTSRDR
ncbi:hypothetical protein [Streptomyces sp. NPDC005281]|uniref:hypothetical protein n=1 Tax=Streptomyces sp. NPDC005281 TaxID=3155712 RepID=UPI0033A8F8D5